MGRRLPCFRASEPVGLERHPSALPAAACLEQAGSGGFSTKPFVCCRPEPQEVSGPEAGKLIKYHSGRAGGLTSPQRGGTQIPQKRSTTTSTCTSTITVFAGWRSAPPCFLPVACAPLDRTLTSLLAIEALEQAIVSRQPSPGQNQGFPEIRQAGRPRGAVGRRHDLPGTAHPGYFGADDNGRRSGCFQGSRIGFVISGY